jgi:HAD superfamily hydrolase (TIGR01490 family)
MLAALQRSFLTVTLAIFDLDNTLLGGDSDNLWGEFVCERGLVDGEDFAARNDQFYADYKAGTLDIEAYLRFALSTLAGRPREQLDAWHRDFMAAKIVPILLPKAEQLLDTHRAQNHDLLIITATNSFITRPIAELMGVSELIACEGEIVDDMYTGEPFGVPSYHAGKVTRLNAWLAQRKLTLDGAYFYSDSHNDLPLLEIVDHPVAVDPDDRLRARADDEGWPIISLRD